MSYKQGKRSLLKRFADSQWAWDHVLGPAYNRRILKAASRHYLLFIGELDLPNTAEVLDVGSGPGHLSLMLAQDYPDAKVVGVDYSEGQVRAASHRRNRTGADNCRFIYGDAMDLPFEDSMFDRVVSLGSIKYWPDMKRGLKEIHRVLVTGGRAFIAEADRDSPRREVLDFNRGFTTFPVIRNLINWFTVEVIFGESVTAEEAEAATDSIGFQQVSVEKLEGFPFFLMKLHK
ncbi:MAG: class I SAM-dependent methyltransferase [Planctomycetes bacterium]|nr:class I SAM-dependent methyltransferase [Planctomycetota bacterium]